MKTPDEATVNDRLLAEALIRGGYATKDDALAAARIVVAASKAVLSGELPVAEFGRLTEPYDRYLAVRLFSGPDRQAVTQAIDALLVWHGDLFDGHGHQPDPALLFVTPHHITYEPTPYGPLLRKVVHFRRLDPQVASSPAPARRFGWGKKPEDQRGTE